MCCCLYTLLLQVLKELLAKEHKDRDDYTDQLEELECGITKPEMLTMVHELMAMRLEGTSHLGIFTTLYELRASHQTCVRHEWLREMVCTCSALHNETLCANARICTVLLLARTVLPLNHTHCCSMICVGSAGLLSPFREVQLQGWT